MVGGAGPWRGPAGAGGCYNYSFSQFAVGTDANGLTGTAISQVEGLSICLCKRGVHR